MKALCSLLAVVVVFAAFSAFAEDVDPPDWRYSEGSTYQKWEFNTDLPTNIPPESCVSNIYGDPHASIVCAEWQWTNVVGPGAAGGSVNGWFFFEPCSVRFYLPNHDKMLENKDIRVQVTSTGYSNTVVFTQSEWELMGTSVTQWPNAAWTTHIVDFSLWPNPVAESVEIWFPLGSILHEVVIDTRCFPEPGMGIALALLGTAAWRKMRG